MTTVPAALAPARTVPERRAPDTLTPFPGRRPNPFQQFAWALSVHAAFPRRLRKFLRKKLGNANPGPFDITVDRVRFRAYPAENRCDRILVGRRTLPELDEHALIAPLLSPDMVFVDVGANIGTYALWVGTRIGAGGTVIAFEPHPRTFAKLEFNRQANRADNVIAKNLAVAAEKGTMVLFHDGGGNIGNTSLIPEVAGAAHVPDEIAVAPLAAVLSELDIKNVDLLKIDIEGFEDRALLPFFEQADRSLWPAAILLETALRDHWQRDCLAELQDKGYRRRATTEENVLLVREETRRTSG